MSALSRATRGRLASSRALARATRGRLDLAVVSAPAGANAPDELALGAVVAAGQLGARVELHTRPGGASARVRGG